MIVSLFVSVDHFPLIHSPVVNASSFCEDGSLFSLDTKHFCVFERDAVNSNGKDVRTILKGIQSKHLLYP